jgi:formylglycine-generating enzyme required for sulfatase activity
VPDTSEFAQRLKSTLLREEGACIDPARIFDRVKEVARTQPLLGVLPNSGHESEGSFLFFKREVAAVRPEPAPQPAPYTPPVSAVDTGSIQVSSAVAGTVQVDGADTGVSIKVEGTVTIANVGTGLTTVGVRTPTGQVIAGPSVLVRAGARTSVRIERPVPDGFVRINGGTFLMGSPATEVGRSDNEGPQHSVTVSGFYMSKYEVTQKEWTAVMGSNPSYFKGDNLPVECVSWYDAIEYCNKRSVKEGLTPAYTRNGNNVTWNRSANGYRLPTEAEWEYACRAGTTTAYSTGGSITAGQANYDWNIETTTNVGSYSANAWGLYDMHGNVWEWCWDWYGDYSGGAQTDPVGASSGTSRLNRGGGWRGTAQYARSANRYYDTPSSRGISLGFRLVRP